MPWLSSTTTSRMSVLSIQQTSRRTGKRQSGSRHRKARIFRHPRCADPSVASIPVAGLCPESPVGAAFCSGGVCTLLLLKYMGAYDICMDSFLTESERERISEFASTPKYARDPEMLLPDDDSD